MLYIEFHFAAPANFQSLQDVYQTIAPLKNNYEQKPLDFWVALIPDLVKSYLRMRNPKVANSNFKKMVHYLQIDLEARFDGLQIIAPNRGRLDFSTNNFPYGGMDRLMVFVKAFDCTPVKIYNGFETQSVTWVSKFDFDCDAISESE